MITVNMQKARAIKRDSIRAERKPMLEALDIQMLRAIEEGDSVKQADIAKKKQALRDATEDSCIVNADSVEELQSATPLRLI